MIDEDRLGRRCRFRLRAERRFISDPITAGRTNGRSFTVETGPQHAGG